MPPSRCSGVRWPQLYLLPLPLSVLPLLTLLMMVTFVAQPAPAQWAYDGPAAGCLDVLDVWTDGERGNLTSGSSRSITVGTSATVATGAFFLHGPACTIRGAFQIILEVGAMRVVANSLRQPSVPIAIGPGVHFEALLDTGTASIISGVSTDWPLRLPSVTVRFAKTGYPPPPMEPDALPVDLSIDGVSWALRGASFQSSSTTAVPVWNPITFVNGQYLPRHSRIAITNASLALEGCVMNTTQGAFVFSMALLFLPNSNPLVLLENTTLVVDAATVTVKQTQATSIAFDVLLIDTRSPMTLQGDQASLAIHNSSVTAVNTTAPHGIRLFLLLSNTLVLQNNSAMTIKGCNVAATNSSSTRNGFHLAVLYIQGIFQLDTVAQLTLDHNRVAVANSTVGDQNLFLSVLYTISTVALFDNATMLVRRCAVNAMRSDGKFVKIIIVHLNGNNPTTLHSSAQVGVYDSTVTNSGGRSTGLELSLVYSYGNLFSLINTSRLTMSGCNVITQNSTSDSTTRLSLLFRYLLPITLHNASQLTVSSSTVAVVSSRGGNVAVGGVLLGLGAVLLLDDAQWRLEGLALTVGGVSASLSLQVFAMGVLLGHSATLDLSDRGRVLITHSTAAIINTTYVNSGGAQGGLATVLGVPTVTLRNSSTVRVCASTASITDSTIRGTYYPSLRSSSSGGDNNSNNNRGGTAAAATTGMVAAVFGTVLPLDGCNASSSSSSRPSALSSTLPPCGLYVASTMRLCFRIPTRTETASVTPKGTPRSLSETVTMRPVAGTETTDQTQTRKTQTATYRTAGNTVTLDSSMTLQTSLTDDPVRPASRTKSSTAMLSLTRTQLLTATPAVLLIPVPAGTLPPQLVLEPVVGTTETVTGTVGAIGVVSTVAAVIGTSGAIVRISQCADDDDDDGDKLSFLVHPLRFKAGTGPARFLRGAIIGNTIIVPAGAVLTFGVLMPLGLLLWVRRRRRLAFAQLGMEDPQDGAALSLWQLVLVVVLPWRLSQALAPSAATDATNSRSKDSTGSDLGGGKDKGSSGTARQWLWARGMLHELRQGMGWPSVMVLPQVAMAEGSAMAVTRLLTVMAADDESAAAVVPALVGLGLMAVVLAWWARALVRVVPSADVQLVPASRLGVAILRRLPQALLPVRYRHASGSEPSEALCVRPSDEGRAEGSWWWVLLLPAFEFVVPGTNEADDGDDGTPTLAVPLHEDSDNGSFAAGLATRDLRRAELEARHDHMIGGKALRWAEFGGHVCALGVGIAEGMPASSSSLCTARVGIAFALIIVQGLCGLTTVVPVENAAVTALSMASFVTAGAALMNVVGGASTDRTLLRRSATAVGVLGLVALSVALLRPLNTLRRMLRAADAMIDAELSALQAAADTALIGRSPPPPVASSETLEIATPSPRAARAHSTASAVSAVTSQADGRDGRTADDAQSSLATASGRSTPPHMDSGHVTPDRTTPELEPTSGEEGHVGTPGPRIPRLPTEVAAPDVDGEWSQSAILHILDVLEDADAARRRLLGVSASEEHADLHTILDDYRGEGQDDTRVSSGSSA